MLRQLPSLTIVALLLGVSATAAQVRPAPAALARSLQQRYQGIKDFSASFVHTYRGGVLRTQSREEGTVSVKKPGQMRWLYTRPERKEFVSDGHKLYTYLPSEREVRVSDVPADDSATTPALFLAGKGDLTRDFTAVAVDSPVPGAWALKLTPKREEPDYEYLVVAVDPATLQIRALTTKDRQGGESTLVFSNLKENRGIPDKEFVFAMPKDRVTVITDGVRN